MFEALRDIRLGLAALLLLFIFGYFGFFEPASENEAKKPATIPVYRHKNAYAVDEALIPPQLVIVQNQHTQLLLTLGRLVKENSGPLRLYKGTQSIMM